MTTLNGHDAPAVLSYDGAPDPLSDPALMAALRQAAAKHDPESACAAVSASQQAAGGLLDPKIDTTLRAGAGVPSPPKVRWSRRACH